VTNCGTRCGCQTEWKARWVLNWKPHQSTKITFFWILNFVYMKMNNKKRHDFSSMYNQWHSIMEISIYTVFPPSELNIWYKELNSSLTCLQRPASGLWSEPVQSSLNLHILFLKHWHFYPPNCAQVSNTVSSMRCPAQTVHLFLTSFMPSCPFHPPWFNHPNNTRWRVKIMKLLFK
jgi:hypothetical protein